MAKVTSKLQVTLPKVIADQYHIRPGDQIEWAAAGEVIRVVPGAKENTSEAKPQPLRLFDQATERQRNRDLHGKVRVAKDRGWRREDLYKRGISD
ncbi:MAG: AbrB/MazE/SpoVT family DNA-binding domain-containing protein [Bryobacterales bacterium]|nr:AbrB/MazE/SpoVT family DNA-binding domain-containing protein [Bryobacterales bacterium]MBV9396354.1 AbrB/MazE/SpoVT family DNA-binding domain-containing protein [Bryobacterales bacterium]